MGGDCKGTINQDNGGLNIEFDNSQCQGCEEKDCFGKLAQAPSESEPNDLIPPNISAGIAAKEQVLNKFNEKSREALEHIMQGGAHSFIIITVGGGQIQENCYMKLTTKREVYSKIAVRDMEDMFKGVTASPNRLGTLLNGLFK